MKVTKKIQTTDTGCIQACFASLLDLPVDRVPNFSLNGDWWNEALAWLQRHNKTAIYINLDNEHTQWGETYRLPIIMVGISTVGSLHAVVGIAHGDTIEQLHDPSPQNIGIKEGGLIGVIVISEALE
jgi:hypothetical protein